MIGVDKIVFNFTTQDEPFTHNLYAKWDDFCRHTIEQIIDEVLSSADQENKHLVVDRLELNVGNIPEEQFYRLFPVRLREELERITPLLKNNTKEYGKQERVSAIFYYLTHGFFESAWTDSDFHLSPELKKLRRDDSDLVAHLIQRCLLSKNPLLFERLFLQTDNTLLSGMWEDWLSSKTIQTEEQRSVLSAFAMQHPSHLLWLLEKTNPGRTFPGELLALLDQDAIASLALSLFLRSPETLEDFIPPTDKDTKAGNPAAYLKKLNQTLLQRIQEQGYFSLANTPSKFVRLIHITDDVRILEQVADTIKPSDLLQLRDTSDNHPYHSDPVIYCGYEWLVNHYETVKKHFPDNREQFVRKLNLAILKSLKKYDSSPEKAESIAFLLCETLGRDQYIETLATLSDPSLSLPPPLLQVIRELSLRTSSEETSPPSTGNTQKKKATEAEIIPEYMLIHNAGLALLTPWLPRLFSILGLLTEDKKDFKNTESRIKAIFIMQRLVTSENKEYREQELSFNRLLVGCPFHIPLPKTMELETETIQTADSMLTGVMTNWPKMKNTSVTGFQNSFIRRDGTLEKQAEKLCLRIFPKSFDILLDSLPWSYKLIRFPWLKQPIAVEWR